jgi:hypothetical protein
MAETSIHLEYLNVFAKYRLQASEREWVAEASKTASWEALRCDRKCSARVPQIASDANVLVLYESQVNYTSLHRNHTLIVFVVALHVIQNY